MSKVELILNFYQFDLQNTTPKGKLKSNFSICDIVLTKDELDKIWKKNR